ncbi:invasion associated locus B family protein [Neogemmobacter tilapiae]|uniref:Invasion-associated locus B family protein n=1 Tax=Neogemmobacter tilapiae TaxID=875041 RepID=A0A918WGA4_9RHOB|nr:invasion associated locus B family protein [Gemmobacter tilapiae]GHC44919.1 invasion-associated locus B family protein [Gemmobacter tilapiae]
MAKTKLTPLLALVLMLGTGNAVMAQEATTEAPEAGTTTETAVTPPAEGEAAAPAEGAADPASEFSMGQPDPDGPGSIYVAATHGDWQVRCVKTEDGSDPCQMYQLLKGAEGNAVAEIALFPLPAGGEAAAGANFIAPLGTLLTEALRLGVDGATQKVYPFTWCDNGGCVARVGLTTEELAGFKKGNALKATIVPVGASTEKVDVTVSLKGFTAAYDALPVPKE